MSDNTYSTYLSVKSDYYSEINVSSIKRNPEDWKNTYPHKEFINLLSVAGKVLSGSSPLQKGIWVHGSYGTGKSRAAWTLAELLKCSDEEFNDYFNNYERLKKETQLKDRLSLYREKKIVAPCRYTSGDINSPEKLIYALYDTISEELSKQNLDSVNNKTIRGSIAEWLNDETHKSMFEIARSKPEYAGLGSLAGKTVEEIIQELKGDKQVFELLNAFEQMFLNADLPKFSFSVEELVNWIRDVIETNSIGSIVFIWDEFSHFFKENYSSVDTFQRIVEASNEIPFYIVMVTHDKKILNLDGSESVKVLSSRFIEVPITMPDNVAIELISQAIKVNAVVKDEWEQISDALSSSVNEPLKKVAEQTKVDELFLRKILPIHPIAALALKHISEVFASNQRSMFNFIKMDDSDNLQAFQWFIQTYGEADANPLLSIDLLWNFFYEKGTDIHGQGSGRDNLDISVRRILDNYSKYSDQLYDKQKRVLKAVLIMQAIGSRTDEKQKLLNPSPYSLALAFKGTDLENEWESIINNLVNSKILFERKISPSEVRYAAVATAENLSRVDEIKTELKNSTTTFKLISNDKFGCESILPLSPSQRARFEIRYATSDNLDRHLTELKTIPTYKMGLVLAIAKDDEEANKIRTIINDKKKNGQLSESTIIVDATYAQLGAKSYAAYLDAMATYEYLKDTDRNMANNSKKTADGILESWKQDIASRHFTAYAGNNTRPLQDKRELIDYLKTYVSGRFEVVFDEGTEALFQNSQIPKGVEYGASGSSGGVYVKELSKYFGIDLKSKDYCAESPTLPISKMKKAVDSIIINALDTEKGGKGRISFDELISALVSKGLLPCNIYAYALGLTLKDCLNGNYWCSYGDGVSNDILDVEKLKQAIHNSFLSLTGKSGKTFYLEQISKAQKEFMKATCEIFNIPESQSTYTVISGLRSQLTKLGYPIWCLNYSCTDSQKSFVQKYAELSNSNKDKESSVTIAEEIGKMLLTGSESIDSLKQLFTADSCKKSMMKFLESFNEGSLSSLSKQLKTDLGEDVRNLFKNGEYLWLWDQEVGEGELENLKTQYNIVILTNEILKTDDRNWSGCMNSWISFAKKIRIPYSLLGDKIPEARQALRIIHNIVRNNDVLPDEHSKFLTELSSSKESIISINADYLKIFADIGSQYLKGFQDEDIAKVHRTLSVDSFTTDQSTYFNSLKSISDEIQKTLKKVQLDTLWKKMTNTKDPRDWSQKHRTPILAIVDRNEKDAADSAFRTILSPKPLDLDVDSAIDYLNKKPSFVKKMDSQSEIDSAFAKEVLGQYSSMVGDLNEIRLELEDTGIDVYAWYSNKEIDAKIRAFALKAYNEEGRKSVMKTIENLSPEEAKKYLMDLASNNLDVGMVILSKK